MAAQPRHLSLQQTSQQHTARDLRAQAEDVNDNIRSMLDHIDYLREHFGEQYHAVKSGWDLVGQLHKQYVDLLAEARRYKALTMDIGA